ncbi:PQQ-binding-like beta-propeller repeat protein [Streptomyces sp. NPDC006339]|uniref:outer membrane protein assembly factor BamB family protein n=1 Tax=Streptomyces sp. NPDC006339 TaxID=3156755 RepID=UPI0033A1F96E
MAARTTDDTKPGRERWPRHRGGTGRLGPLLAAVAALLVFGSASGCSALEVSLRVVWEAPVDDNARDYGNGAWLVGDTLVRSRYDAVTAFDAGSGERRWQYAPPGQDHVCAVGRRVAGSVLLLARGNRGPGGQGCATVAALDLTTGRELWHVRRTPADLTESFTDMVAAGGGLAVLRDADDFWNFESIRPAVPATEALRAFDLRTGTPRWKAAVPAGCAPERVAAGERQVLAVLTCSRTELRLAAFDRTDGKERWSTPLGGRPTPGTDAQATLLSADPVLVQVGGTQQGGLPGAYLTFGEDGTLLGRIESTGRHGTLLTHRPELVAVADGRLYAVAEAKRGKQYVTRVVAFDLTQGTEVWRHDLDSGRGALALEASDGHVTVLARSLGRRHDGTDELLVLDAVTGDERDNRDTGVDIDHKTGELADLLTYKDLVVAVRWGWGVRPFSAYQIE